MDPYIYQVVSNKNTDFVGSSTKINISSYIDSIFKFFMSKKSQHSVVLEYIFTFTETTIFTFLPTTHLNKMLGKVLFS